MLVSKIDSTNVIVEKKEIAPKNNAPKTDAVSNKITPDSAVIVNNKTDNNVPKNGVILSKADTDKLSAAGVLTMVGVSGAAIAFCFNSGGPKSMLLGAGIGAALGAGMATAINADSKITKAIGLTVGAAPLFGSMVYGATTSPVKAVLAGLGGGLLVAGFVVGQMNK